MNVRGNQPANAIRPSRKEVERERRVNEIKDAAIVLFARNGYEGTTIEDIALELGYAKASLYYYFPGKEAIVRALILDAMASAGRRMDELMARSGDPVVNLRDLFGYYVDDYGDSKGFFNIYHQVGHFMDTVLGETERLQMRQAMDEMNRRIVGLVQRGMDEGCFIQTDPRVLSEMLLGMIGGLMRQTADIELKGWDRGTMKDTVIGMLMRSILLPAASAGTTRRMK